MNKDIKIREHVELLDHIIIIQLTEKIWEIIKKYLGYFFGTLLLGEHNELNNRDIRVNVGEMSEKRQNDDGEMGLRKSKLLELVADYSCIAVKSECQQNINTKFIG